MTGKLRGKKPAKKQVMVPTSRRRIPKEDDMHTDETSESDDSKTHSSESDSSESDSSGGHEPREVKNETNHLQKQFLLCIGVVIIALLYFIESDDALTDFCDPYKSNNCSDFLKQQMENLSKKHENQDKRLFHVLRAAAMLHVVYNPKPLRPIVIMVYNCHDRPILEEAIYSDISKVYEAVLSPNRRRGTLEINCEEFVGKESDVVQESILKAFENGYEKEGSRVAVVHHFDLLPSCSVLTFHNLCNNDDAPYKDMAIILTVTGEKKNADMNESKALEQIISKKFQEKWKDCPEYLPADKIDAMLSRIANNVVVLK